MFGHGLRLLIPPSSFFFDDGWIWKSEAETRLEYSEIVASWFGGFLV